MRHIYVRIDNVTKRARTTIQATPQDFLESTRCRQLRFASQDDFLNRCCQEQWIQEMSAVLRAWLCRDRTIFSIGSGLGEHEILLFRHGYDIIASDFVEGSCEEAVRLFKGFRAVTFDILNPVHARQYDAVLLLAGMDQYFDDNALVRIFDNARGLIKRGGRLIFAQRHHDTICTRLLDFVLCPLLTGTLNFKYALEGRPERWVRQVHAYARSRREIVALAQQAGYQSHRIGFAGFGVEWTRLMIDLWLPTLYSCLHKVDRRFRCSNNVTMFEFVPEVVA